MSTEVVKTGIKGLSSFLNQDNVKQKFTEILGNKANGFLASVLSAVNSNELLKNAEQNSIYMAAMMAASLDLPVNSNLGHAFIIPYNTKIKGKNGQPDRWVQKAQFQISSKGFKQLAIRSGQFKLITEAVVYEGQLISQNPLKGFEFDWDAKISDKVIGYVSYFKLNNGYESTFYMTSKEIEIHGAKYSKTFKYGLWQTDRDKMALKTVTKLNLSKNAPLSIEMQRATLADQSVIKNFDPSDENTIEVETDYVDNPKPKLDPKEVSEEKEYQRVTDHINNAKTIKSLKQINEFIKDMDQQELYNAKLKELQKPRKPKDGELI